MLSKGEILNLSAFEAGSICCVVKIGKYSVFVGCAFFKFRYVCGKVVGKSGNLGRKFAELSLYKAYYAV